MDYWRLPRRWGGPGTGCGGASASPSASSLASAQAPTPPSASPHLPIDFFESCLPLSQIAVQSPIPRSCKMR